MVVGSGLTVICVFTNCLFPFFFFLQTTYKKFKWLHRHHYLNLKKRRRVLMTNKKQKSTKEQKCFNYLKNDKLRDETWFILRVTSSEGNFYDHLPQNINIGIVSLKSGVSGSSILSEKNVKYCLLWMVCIQLAWL
jgi:hypothetical protein